jgi:hypothetical protein
MTRGGGRANTERLSKAAIDRAAQDRQALVEAYGDEGTGERQLAEAMIETGPNRQERRAAQREIKSIDALVAVVGQKAVADYQKKQRNRKREKIRRRTQRTNRKAG